MSSGPRRIDRPVRVGGVLDGRVVSAVEDAVSNDQQYAQQRQSMEDMQRAAEIHPDVDRFYNMGGGVDCTWDDHVMRLWREESYVWAGAGTWFYDPNEPRYEWPPFVPHNGEEAFLLVPSVADRVAMAWEDFQRESAELLEAAARRRD